MINKSKLNPVKDKISIKEYALNTIADTAIKAGEK